MANATGQVSNQALWNNAVIEIHRLHTEILSHARTSLDKAIRIGEVLTSVKSTLKHGEWLPWLKEYCPFSERTARNYVFCFDKRSELKSANVADLSEAYAFQSLLSDGNNGEKAPQMLHEPNDHSRFVKAKQLGLGIFNHWIQRRPLKHWETEELFDTLASVEPWIGIGNAIREELKTRPDAPSGY